MLLGSNRSYLPHVTQRDTKWWQPMGKTQGHRLACGVKSGCCTYSSGIVLKVRWKLIPAPFLTPLQSPFPLCFVRIPEMKIESDPAHRGSICPQHTSRQSSFSASFGFYLFSPRFFLPSFERGMSWCGAEMTVSIRKIYGCYLTQKTFKILHWLSIKISMRTEKFCLIKYVCVIMSGSS